MSLVRHVWVRCTAGDLDERVPVPSSWPDAQVSQHTTDIYEAHYKVRHGDGAFARTLFPAEYAAVMTAVVPAPVAGVAA